MAEHAGLKNLYKQVVSGSFGWDRWGLLGCLGDCVLNYVTGNILEIGCGESSIIFSKLAEKYNRKCFHVEYSKSGVENMKNTKGYFGNNSSVFRGTSDEFFDSISGILRPIALAFIDGSHEYDVVYRDFWNTIGYLDNKGFIFLHDTLPPSIDWTTNNKCGTVFRLRKGLEEVSTLEVFTFPFSAFDVGLTMVRKKENREWEIMNGSDI